MVFGGKKMDNEIARLEAQIRKVDEQVSSLATSRLGWKLGGTFRRPGWLTALAALLVVATPALANDTRDFTVHNETPFNISAVYFSTAGLSQWIPSRGSYIASGDNSDISFTNQGPCRLQMRIGFPNGRSAEWDNGFDFCSVSDITITYNRVTNTFNAAYD
jgi:hypothetical protein